MNPPDALKEIVAEGRALRRVGENIYSVLPDAPHEHVYDRRAALYDFFVSTRLYNRVMWGASPLDYEAFARRALSSHQSGRILDAPCGSMLFTARAHLAHGRPVVAVDQSLRMLERARARLSELAGRVPEHVTLLQADLSDLPLRPASFETILCMNVLHLYEDAAGLIPRLERLLADGGSLHLTSLVTNGRFVGDRYLGALFRAGEFVRPRSAEDLKKLLNDSSRRSFRCRTQGNMLYAETDELS